MSGGVGVATKPVEIYMYVMTKTSELIKSV